ncbi:MAG TPA: hypothetical protein P5121_26055 [Caldilineaceae bacterium]|nr:hypothetical protein [Caldilineaceae bacterium]
MRNWFGAAGIMVIVLLGVLIIFGVLFSLIALIGLALGRVVAWFSPTFSYFEATLLATLFAFITFALLRILARLFLPAELLPDNSSTGWTSEEGEHAANYQLIPQERFYTNPAERTWEAWFKAEVANDVYAEFQHAPQAAANLNQSQLQELSIRLAEAGINIVKRKTGRARRLSTNLNDLRRELNRMGLRPYDDHILRLALSAINMNLNFFEDPLRDVIRRQEWDQPSTMPESE